MEKLLPITVFIMLELGLIGTLVFSPKSLSVIIKWLIATTIIFTTIVIMFWRTNNHTQVLDYSLFLLSCIFIYEWIYFLIIRRMVKGSHFNYRSFCLEKLEPEMVEAIAITGILGSWVITVCSGKWILIKASWLIMMSYIILSMLVSIVSFYVTWRIIGKKWPKLYWPFR